MSGDSTLDRFFRYVREDRGCWVWTGATSHGYGRFQSPGLTVVAHRWLYEQMVGPIPEGLTLDHLCNNTACVNVLEHLDPVPIKVNVRRGPRHNTNKTHCPRGHAYDDVNTRHYRGRRYCRACMAIHNASARAKAA